MLHLFIIAFLHVVEGSFVCRDLPVFRRIFFIKWTWLRYLLPWMAVLVYLTAGFLEHREEPLPQGKSAEKVLKEEA